MENLMELIALEEALKVVEDYKNILKDKSTLKRLEGLKNEYTRVKNNYIMIEKELKKVLKDNGEFTNSIESGRLELEKEEDILYNKAGSDLKLIEGTEKRIEKIKDIISTLEDKSFKLLEKEEDLKIKVKELKRELVKVKEKFNNLKEEQLKTIEETKKGIMEKEIEIERLKENISKESLDKYMSLREIKGSALSAVKDNICTGCSVKLPAIIIDKLRRGKGSGDTVYCTNCGRILYYES